MDALVRRVMSGVVVLWGVVTIVFFVGRVLPGDVATLMSGPVADPAIIAATRERLGLDRPLLQQYGSYMQRLLRGDLGESLVTRRPVREDLQMRLPASLELIGAALLLALLVGGLLAARGALHPGGVADRLGAAVTVGGVAVPSFLLGLLLLIVFFVWLPIAPAPLGRLGPLLQPPPPITGFYTVDALLTGRLNVFGSALAHLALPTLALGIPIVATLLRVLRAGIAAAHHSDAVQAAQLAGVASWRLWQRYILPLAVLPLLPLLASIVGWSLGGVVLIEHIFAWNGAGSYAVDAIQRGDYTAIQGFVLVASLLYVVSFLAADVLTWLIDPRTR